MDNAYRMKPESVNQGGFGHSDFAAAATLAAGFGPHAAG